MTIGVYQAAPVPEDTGVVIYHRVVGDDATDDTPDLMVQADVSTIVAKVWDKATGSQSGADQTLTVATVVLDTPVTLNGVAYNFKWKVPASLLSGADKVYVVEILVTPTAGQQFYLRPVEIPTIPMHSS